MHDIRRYRHISHKIDAYPALRVKLFADALLFSMSASVLQTLELNPEAAIYIRTIAQEMSGI
jgi:hypothetical protein